MDTSVWPNLCHILCCSSDNTFILYLAHGGSWACDLCKGLTQIKTLNESSLSTRLNKSLLTLRLHSNIDEMCKIVLESIPVCQDAGIHLSCLVRHPSSSPSILSFSSLRKFSAIREFAMIT